MEKTTVYLTREQQEALGELSRRSGRPQAHLIREALAVYLVEHPAPRLRPNSWGSVADGSVSSEQVDDWLAENWTPDW